MPTQRSQTKGMRSVVSQVETAFQRE
jgi:hypothetical protein